MDYADFAIRLEAGSRHTYRARVLDSPAGQGSAVFSPPGWAPRTLDHWTAFGRDLVRAIHGSPNSTPDRLGQELFRALFSGQVRERYNESVGRVKGGRKTGLRIRLCFDPDDREGFSFARFPWELLCVPVKKDFLGCLRDISICRYLEVPRPAEPILFKSPLRIALLASNPVDQPSLEVAREVSRIKSIWEHKGGAEVVPLPMATVTSLRRQLLDGDFHVLHFMGHGAFDKATGQGSVVLETNGGYADRLKGEDFADLLKGLDRLLLVVLNACRTAQSAFERDFDPFGGVAPALVRAGLPAVVAMQLSISDSAALAFSEMFYERLAQGDSLDEAMAEGRLAIRAQDRDSLEWAIPALFMRSQDGRILELAGRTEIERGLLHLESGDLSSARTAFRQAVSANPLSAEARLYLSLCRLSGQPLHQLTTSEADELDSALGNLAGDKNEEVAGLARWLLAVLRHDVFTPRRIRPKGPAFPNLQESVARKRPSLREMRLLRQVRCSRNAILRLNLAPFGPENHQGDAGQEKW